MSGNTTQTASQAGQAKFAEAGHSLFPIPCFVIGVFVGTVLVHSNLRHPLRVILGVVAAMLAVGIAASFLPSLPGWVSVLLLSLAMGTMSTTVTRVGEQAVSVSYVTGSLTNMMQHVALALKERAFAPPTGIVGDAGVAGEVAGERLDRFLYRSSAGRSSASSFWRVDFVLTHFCARCHGRSRSQPEPERLGVAAARSNPVAGCMAVLRMSPVRRCAAGGR